MGNEIAYHDISWAHQIQNFLKQGGAVSLQPPPGGQLPGPLRTPRSQSVLPTIQNWMTPMHKQRGRGCGVGAAAPPPIFWWQLGEMSHSGEFTIGHGGSMESGHGISGGNGTNLRIYYKVMWILPSAETSFNSWTFKVLKPTSFRGLCTLDPARDVPQTPPGALKDFWSC